MSNAVTCTNPHCASCGRPSSSLELIFRYIDEKNDVDLEIGVQSLPKITVSTAIKDALELLYLDNVSQNDVRLTSIGYEEERYCVEREEAQRTLYDLGLRDGWTLYFEPLPNASPPKPCHLTIVAPNEVDRIDYQWDCAKTTVRMLLKYVLKKFSLESIRRERVHLVTIFKELDLFSDLNKRLSTMDVHSGMSVYVHIIPPLTPTNVPVDKDIHVKCIFDANEFILKVPDTCTISELTDDIAKNVPSHHIIDFKLFDATSAELYTNDLERTLRSFGIKPGQQIVAKFRQISRRTVSSTGSYRNAVTSSPSSSAKKSKSKVKVTCQFPSKEFETLSMSVEDTVANLISKVEALKRNPRWAISKIRSNSISIDIKELHRSLAELGIQPDAVIDVTVIEKSQTYASIVSKTPSSSSPQRKTNQKDRPRKPIGLDNLGNSCYINSALQCLAHVPPLTKFFLQGIDHAHMKDGEHTDDEWNPYDQVGDITGSYADFLWNIWRCYDQLDSFKPTRIKDKIGEKDARFKTTDQQDAQEFMSFLLDTIHKELKAKNENDRNTIIKQLFFGKITSTILCTACNSEESTTNPISFLSIPLNRQERTFWITFITVKGKDHLISIDVPICGRVGHVVEMFTANRCKNPDLFFYIMAMLHDGEIDFKTPLSEITNDEMVFLEQEERSNNVLPEVLELPTKKSTLINCLEQFFAREQLENERTCQRSSCQQNTIAIKQLRLSSLPSVLIIQFKRFSHENGLHQKVETFVEYPITGLDLSTCLPYLQDQAVYDLIAVSNHHGSINGGHYTAYARQTRENKTKWYLFDDTSVKTVSPSYYEEDIVSKDAYLLFYIKRELLEAPNQMTTL